MDLAAGWVVVQLKLPSVDGPVASSLALDGEDDLPYPPLFLGAADKGSKFVGKPQFRYLPARMRMARLSVFGAAPAASVIQAIVWELGPLSFLFYLLLRVPHVPLGWVLRSRSGGLKLQMFRATYLLQSERSPISYQTWFDLFETETFRPRPNDAALAKLQRDIRLAVVVERSSQSIEDVSTTLQSLERQSLRSARLEVVEPGKQRLAELLTDLCGDPRITHIVGLEAGIRLAVDALAMLAAPLLGPQADVVYGDHDYYAAGTGQRHSPRFQPPWCNPSSTSWDVPPALFAVRKECLKLGTAPEWKSVPALGMAVLQRNVSSPGTRLRAAHIPQMLCHVPDTLLQRSNKYSPSLVSMTVGSTSAKVTIVIASAFRQGIADRFLPRILQQTHYQAAEYIITVHEKRLADPANAELVQRLQSDPRVRILPHGVDQFNFALIANRAARGGDGEFVCFLNDDIDIIDGTWLDRLVCVMEHDHIGAVSARLLYPDGCIQHDGVVVGLMGAGEHWNRFAPNDRPREPAAGFTFRDVSAATGACLLVRQDAFASIGGFDERFSVGYNDIDLCLRLGVKGWRIVVATNVELYHCETASLEREESLAASGERNLFRKTWRELLASEPYFNPNVSLATATTFALAVPPRDRSPRIYDTGSPAA
ncbi:MAG: glycosyltransferase [Xanthobacteraceae bacterium]|nr:glycosyltransferase [Xanthobacteraceae bacterium]